MKNIKKKYFNILIILVLTGILVTYTLYLKKYTVSAAVPVFTHIILPA